MKNGLSPYNHLFFATLTFLQEPCFGGTSSKSSSLFGLRGATLLCRLCALTAVFAVGVRIAEKLTTCPIRPGDWVWHSAVVRNKDALL